MILYRYTQPDGGVTWHDHPEEVFDMFGGKPSDCIKGEWTQTAKMVKRTTTRDVYGDHNCIWQEGYIFKVCDETPESYIDYEGNHHLKENTEEVKS